MTEREEIAPNGDKRYTGHDNIKALVQERSSPSAAARQKAKSNAKPGQGDGADPPVG